MCSLVNFILFSYLQVPRVAFELTGVYVDPATAAAAAGLLYLINGLPGQGAYLLGKQLAYQKYSLKTNDFKWISYWSQNRRTAAFSHLKVISFDPNESVAKESTRFLQDPLGDYFLGTVGKTTPFTEEVQIPTHDYYDGLGYDRGHLLASEIIRQLLNLADTNVVEYAYRSMTNVFPQNRVCNQGKEGTGEFWRKIETDSKNAGGTCLGSTGDKKGVSFLITHALIPSVQTPFPFPQSDLGWSDWILTNYCCIDKGNIRFSRMVLTSNPLTGTECQAYDSDDPTNTPQIVWKDFLAEAKGKYTDLDKNTHPFQIITSGPNVCINGLSI